MKSDYVYIVDHEQTQGRRPNQEDAVRSSDGSVYEEKGILVVLSDGMGGMNEGERFSEIATRNMVSYFERTEPKADVRQELLACFGEAQQEALKLVQSGVHGGATVVAVLVRDYRCSFLCVGDSSLCLIRNGGLIHLNRMHTLGVSLDESVALGYLDKEYADFNTHRDSLTSYLGCEEVCCDVCSVPFIMQPGDRIALMSDGVTGALSDEELIEAISGGSVQQAVERVIAEVLKKDNPRQDNASIAIISMEERAKDWQGAQAGPKGGSRWRRNTRMSR